MVLSLLEIQRRVIQTKYSTSFFTLSEKKWLPNIQKYNCKKFYSQYVCLIVSKNVFINCFDKCFLFYVITGRHCFYKSLLIPWGLFNRHVLALLETSNLLRPHDKTAILSSMLIPTWKVPKSSFRISYFLNFLYYF